MIFYFGDGRLGNQLFQYHFIRSILSDDHIVFASNFDEMHELFNPLKRVINIRNKYIKYVIRKLAIPLLQLFAQLKLVTSFKVDCYWENGFYVPDVTYTKTLGLLPINYIYPCFAQSEQFFKPEVTKNMEIKKIYMDIAQNYLSQIPSHYQKVYIHIRRGDYMNFSVLGKPDVTLPLAYYMDRIQWYEANIANPFYIFLTDDYEYVMNSFADVANKVVSKNSVFVDFAIITMCEYGIMSNSSFSWWAAYMMKNRKKIFAPKYWLGWKSDVVYHKGITPGFAEVVNVPK